MGDVDEIGVVEQREQLATEFGGSGASQIQVFQAEQGMTADGGGETRADVLDEKVCGGGSLKGADELEGGGQYAFVTADARVADELLGESVKTLAFGRWGVGEMTADGLDGFAGQF
ncbi:MAG: hypothetical protein N3A53_06440, partial [Verrucomicrobiae bacterium]|nr:hypothetical protein [Verrucomicrobiae bacterium]